MISYTVNQRTHELGLRAALGASSWNLLQLVVQHGLGLTALGLGIGVAGSLALTHLLKSLLFEVSPSRSDFSDVSRRPARAGRGGRQLHSGFPRHAGGSNGGFTL